VGLGQHEPGMGTGTSSGTGMGTGTGMHEGEGMHEDEHAPWIRLPCHPHPRYVHPPESP
jgi:hypothetical protein